MSGRGLFRATGKTAKPVVDMIDGALAKVDHLDREKDDFYPTPPEPTRALLSAEIHRLREFSSIWEPAAGDGAMARELGATGLPVILSDLIDRGCNAEIRSFYDFETPPSKAIVTNPPFQECHGDPAWVRHALSLGCEYIALLLPLGWPGSVIRAAMWAEAPPARVYLMRWRIDFTGQGAPPMLNAWFVWDAKSSGETVLRMLDKHQDISQQEMFEAGQ